MTIIYSYADEEGKPTTNIKEIVTQEVTLIAYSYVEQTGKAPSKELINKWTHTSLKAMGWFDDN